MKKSLWILAALVATLGLNACSSALEESDCTQGQTKCENGQLFSCKSDNHWPALGVICEGGICLNAKQCKPAACVPGEKKCEGAVFSECLRNGETWERVVCGSNINLGAFCHVDHVCVACNLDPDCKSADKHCVDHLCQDLSVQGCVDGQTKCEARKAYTCNKKAWENETVCTNGCDADGKECAAAGGICTDGEKKCQGGLILTCVSTTWNAGANCPEGEQCLDGNSTCTRTSGNVCTANAKSCTANVYSVCNSAGTELTTQSCGTGTYVTTPYCDESKGCIECRTASDCKDTAKPVCNADTKSCQSATVVCTAGQQMCSGNTFKTCNATQSGFDDMVCNAPTPYCDDAKGCIGCRSHNDCSGATSVCNADTKLCEAPVVACTTGTKKCEGKVFSECVSGQWSVKDCATSSQVCDDIKGCVTPSVGKSYLHDFETCNTGQSYADGKCTQADTPDLTFKSGITPAATEIIDNKSLKLGPNGSATVSAPNGVGSLSITIKKVNTKTADVTIKVGGVEVFSQTGMVTNQQIDVVKDNINTSGVVDILINTTERIVLDNLVWTDYN